MSRYDHIQEVQKSRYDVIQEITKFNPYHGPDGRFSSANGAASFTYKPGQGKMYDNAIAREKARTAAAATVAGTPKKGLVAGLGEKHARAIEKLIGDNAPEEVKSLWNKWGDKVIVGDAHISQITHSYCSAGKVYTNIEQAAAGSHGYTPYEVPAHESGHSLDYNLSRFGVRFSTNWNNGAFEKSLVSEADSYFKGKQKAYSATDGTKVSIAETRKRVAHEMFQNGGFERYGDVSDMLQVATKGKFEGPGGHEKYYWTGKKTRYYSIPGQNVSVEAFAEMFSASSTNHKSLDAIKEIFPKSYNVFLQMCKDAATW